MAGLGAPMQGGAQPQGMGMQQQAPQGSPAPMEQQEAGGGAQASQKEQAAYEEFASNLSDVLYPSDKPGEVSPQILQNLQGDFDPQVLALFDGVEPALTESAQDTVAATSVLVTLVVDKKLGLLEQALAAENGQAPRESEPNEEMPGQPEKAPAGYAGDDGEDYSPEAVLMEGGKLAVEELIEIAEAAKLYDFQQEEVDGTFYRALDLFRVAQEKVNPRVVQSLQRGFEQIRAADQAGDVKKVLPGLPGGAPMKQGA